MEFTACNHPPGSDEKIAIMAQRLEHNHPIHHPGDITFESQSNGGHSFRWLMGDGVVVQQVDE